MISTVPLVASCTRSSGSILASYQLPAPARLKACSKRESRTPRWASFALDPYLTVGILVTRDTNTQASQLRSIVFSQPGSLEAGVSRSPRKDDHPVIVITVPRTMLSRASLRYLRASAQLVRKDYRPT